MPATTTAEALTLYDYFERACRAPDRIAFRICGPDAAEELSNRVLFARAGGFAAAYRAGGMTAGTIVLIVLDHSADLLCAFLGAVLAGLVPAVLPPPSKRQDVDVFWQHIAEMTRLAGRAPIVASESLERMLPAGSPLRDHIFISPSRVDNGAAPIAWHRPTVDDVAFLQYSSGTTGLRKGVMITHGMFSAQVESYRDALGIVPADRVASWLPLYHDMGLVACFLMPIAMGISSSLIDPFYWVSRPSVLFREIEAFRATHVWMPNFAFNHLANTVDPSAPYDLGTMRAFINCSEPCKVETFSRFVEAFRSWGVRTEMLQTCYAMAESVFAVTQSPPETPVTVLQRDGSSLLSVGRLVGGLELRITDDGGRDCADGTTGEIELRGSMVTRGYLNNDEATAAALHDGWYRTGDLGFRSDGELYITGRKKELLIIHGRNYYAHDIEALVAGFPEVKPGRVVAFGRANAETGSDDLVIVAERMPAAAGGEERTLRRKIKAGVAEALGVTVAAVTFVPAGWIVKTTSGKIDRDNNRKKYLEGEL